MAVPVFWIGVGVALLAGQEDVTADVGSTSAIGDGLRSPAAGVLAAVLIRLVTSWIAVGLAWPLALRRERLLPPRTYLGASIGIFFDRYRVAGAYRSLRWTHEVRQAALARLGPHGRRLGRLDPAIDVLNVALPVIIIAGSSVAL